MIITSPHQIMYADYFHISPDQGATGDMAAFGAPQTKPSVEYDAPLRDHGTFVPLYFLREPEVNCPIHRIGLSGFSPLNYYRLGQCIAQAVNVLERRVVFVASGDLSHKLRDNGPYSFDPEGPEFDRQITEVMAVEDWAFDHGLSPL